MGNHGEDEDEDDDKDEDEDEDEDDDDNDDDDDDDDDNEDKDNDTETKTTTTVTSSSFLDNREFVSTQEKRSDERYWYHTFERKVCTREARGESDREREKTRDRPREHSHHGSSKLQFFTIILISLLSKLLSWCCCSCANFHQEWPSVIDIYVEGQRVMGNTNPKLGKLLPGSPEDRRFRGLFGVSAQVVVDAWRLMEINGVLPENPQLCHFLWALAFMCIYPKNDKALSSLIGNRDPKTIHKHTWPFIRAVFELTDYVVS